MLERTTRVNLLYDFYEALLSNKQREVFELYYHDDWSLGEIAEKLQVSRQGVYDIIKRSEKALENFESKLGLYHTYCKNEIITRQIGKIVDDSQLTSNTKIEIMKLVKNLQMND